MRMSNEIDIASLSGLSLDWLAGQAMDYKLKIVEAGARLNKGVARTAGVYKSNRQQLGNVTGLFDDSLTLFNPSQDWELLPTYKGLFEVLDYCHIKQECANNTNNYNSWVATYVLNDEQFILEGSTKQEVILRGYIHIKLGYWHKVPAILLEHDLIMA